MLKSIFMASGTLLAVAGLAVFAVALSTGGTGVHAGDETPTVETPTDETPEATATTPVGSPTVAETPTVAATATAGPLTPVATPTTGAAAATPTAELPTTGTGSAQGGDNTMLFVALGLALLAAGGGLAYAGMRRR